MDSNNEGVRAQDARDQSILSRTDIDPVDDITALLVEYGHPAPNNWLDNIDPRALDKNLPPEERRYHVNNQWQTILGLVTLERGMEDTTKARFCLVPRGPLNVWLVLFKQTVLPVAIRWQLPTDDFLWKEGPTA
jgi:hypothetical protein